MNLQLRIMVQERFFMNFRKNLGMIRQNRPSMANDPTILVMMKRCSEIEIALYNSRRILVGRNIDV